MRSGPSDPPATWRDCPKGDSSIGREPTKRAMGDSVVASDEASYVARFDTFWWPASSRSETMAGASKLALDFLLRGATMTLRQLPVPNFI